MNATSAHQPRWRRTAPLAFVLAALMVLWAIAAVVTANRMQGDRIGLWLSQSPATLELAPPSVVQQAFAYSTFASAVERRGDAYAVTISSFPPVPLDHRLEQALRSRSLHDSLALGLYSMRFGGPMLEEFERTGDSQVLSHLARASNIVLDAAERFTLPPEIMAFNDHAVAERTEFLLVFLSKLEELRIMDELRARLRKHILHNAALLEGDRTFTWQTNHGLMQIRALLHLAQGLADGEEKRRALATAVARIEEMLPYLIADDGAVLESASAYWLFIYKEWAYIAGIPVLPTHTRDLIRARLAKVEGFLRTVVNCEGFLQGLGDSYSGRVSGSDVAFAGRASTVFAFSNGLAGFEYPVGDSCAQVLFVSLHTPPPVHKMPEDLAVYVFAREPFFVNTGSYAYDNSAERRYVLARESQSTVTSTDGTAFEYSQLEPPKGPQGGWVFSGEKAGDTVKITREVAFSPETGVLKITDRSDRELRARFNLHPDVGVEEISERELVLKGRKESLRLRHAGRRLWNDRWIAPANFEQKPIRQLEIIGNPITVEINLPPAGLLEGTAISGATRYPARAQLSDELSRKYRASALSRHEWPSRFMKVRAAMLAALVAVAALLLAPPLAALGRVLCAAAAVFLVVDIASKGFLTTALIAFLEHGKI